MLILRTLRICAAVKQENIRFLRGEGGETIATLTAVRITGSGTISPKIHDAMQPEIVIFIERCGVPPAQI